MSLVLVVDDKELMRDSVGSTLQRAGFTVAGAPGGEAALEIAAKRRPSAVVTDLQMPGMTGIELLDRLNELDSDIPVVMMTAFGTIETAVEAMKIGAFDYITKPFEGDELVIAVKRAIAHGKVVRENAVLKASAPVDTSGERGLARVVGDSPAMRRVKEQMIAVAGSQGTVMVCGESGAGKEVVARAIHEMSDRAGGPYLAVNCAALSESLLESELFGHEKGAFTGAEALRKGRFELADGGTLLLDEVSEVSPTIQAKLLRVLQERSFERVGSSTTIGCDVRVIATSNRDLPRAVSAGEFRQDLFFRLNVLPIHLPPLRDRLEDVPGLVEHSAGKIANREGRAPVGFEQDAVTLLQQYAWPGNVRELQNICERAVVLTAARGNGASVSRSMLEPWLTGAGAAPTAHDHAEHMNGNGHTNGHANGHSNGNGLANGVVEAKPGVTLEEIERDVIIATLRRNNGHRQKTAKSLGIGVRTLGLKLKKWKEMQIVEQSL